jgi:Ca-activated chloride channel homolog
MTVQVGAPSERADTSRALIDADRPALAAAQQAGKELAEHLTPGINLGLIAFSGTPAMLVAPTTDHAATVAAINTLQVVERTAIGDAIFTAARAARDQGVPISTIAFGPPDGSDELDGAHIAAPVDDDALKQMGFQTIHADASASWFRLGTLLLVTAALAGLLVNRRLPN